MKKVYWLFAAAFILFSLIFSPWTGGFLPFWIAMPVATAVLAIVGMSINFPKGYFKFKFDYFLIGVISAVVLYFIFMMGKYFANMILPFAGSQVAAIYHRAAGHSPAKIILLLLFVIGPAEEIFWRGFVLKNCLKKYGLVAGVVLSAVLYSAAHLFAMNIMLLIAAFVCGIFWGMIFARYKNLWPVIISHALWDVLIFVLFPLK